MTIDSHHMNSTSRGFFATLERRHQDIDSLLCVGLDPRVDTGPDSGEQLFTRNARIIDATREYTLAYKPNIAFYEAHGTAGIAALERTLSHIGPDIPVILDAKRGDIGATAAAYAQAAFGELGVRCITVSPYLGTDSLLPFLDVDDTALFVLCRTSNPSARELQHIPVGPDDDPFYLKVAETMCEISPRIGLVVGATDGEALRAVRNRHPECWILAPGVGAQGATALETVTNGADLNGGRIIPVVARAVAGADDPSASAIRYRDEIRRAAEQVRSRGTLPPSRYTGAYVPETSGTAVVRDGSDSAPSELSDNALKHELLSKLIEFDCFRTGQFTLKSGLPSPFYVDLRRISSDMRLLALAGEAYARMAKNIIFDRIAAVPVAALTLGTAAAFATGSPLIYPRIPMKAHGTGNRIEGAFKPGERALLLDDLITTGKSKIEALEVLRAENLVVKDLVVLLERGSTGRRDMERAEVRLHSYATIDELVTIGVETGQLTA
ncbi:MAG: orotidine-5'-phosphate decarboxylase, partial [Spirochaetaceae bacterium]